MSTRQENGVEVGIKTNFAARIKRFCRLTEALHIYHGKKRKLSVRIQNKCKHSIKIYIRHDNYQADTLSLIMKNDLMIEICFKFQLVMAIHALYIKQIQILPKSFSDLT